MRAVHKITVPVNDKAVPFQLPPGTEILHVGCQSRDPRFVSAWYEVILPIFSTETRSFQVFGTGHEVPPGPSYVGTAIVPDRNLVWHLYEVPFE